MKKSTKTTKTKKITPDISDGEMGIKPPQMSIEEVQKLLDEAENDPVYSGDESKERVRKKLGL